MKRDLVAVGFLWLILTLLGYALAQVNVLPPVASDKGAVIQGAFRFLISMAVPVVAFVLGLLVYSVVRFRRRPPANGDPPADDGPAIHGRGRTPLLWFAITSSLALLIMVYPGLIELPTFTRAEANPDLVVDVTGFQWAWKASYPAAGVETSQELVLPVERTIRFDVTSADVIHSFWIPAFGMRVDAIPGQTTSFSVLATTTGDYATDAAFRVQCSQLCGLRHAQMTMPVRVVSEPEFIAWLAGQPKASGGAATPVPGGTELTLSAKNIQFSAARLEANAGVPTTITFDNEDAGIVHNLAIYTEAGQLVDSARTSFEPGPVSQILVLPPLPPGSYRFTCDAHPTQMVGTLVVK